MRKLKYVKLFEMYNRNNLKQEKISKELSQLEISIKSCPSTKHLIKEIQGITDLFHVFGVEKQSEIINKLKKLQVEVEKYYDISDHEYLLKDDSGLKHAPTSQLNTVLSLLENYSDK